MPMYIELKDYTNIPQNNIIKTTSKSAERNEKKSKL